MTPGWTDFKIIVNAYHQERIPVVFYYNDGTVYHLAVFLRGVLYVTSIVGAQITEFQGLPWYAAGNVAQDTGGVAALATYFSA